MQKDLQLAHVSDPKPVPDHDDPVEIAADQAARTLASAASNSSMTGPSIRVVMRSADDAVPPILTSALPITRLFGSETLAAVVAFPTAAALDPTGDLTAGVWHRLESAVSGNAARIDPSFDDKQKGLLAGEFEQAGGFEIDGQKFHFRNETLEQLLQFSPACGQASVPKRLEPRTARMEQE